MCDAGPAAGGKRLSRLLREQLNEMMAAGQALEAILKDSQTGLSYLAVLNRGLCRQLRLARLLDLDERMNSEDEVRLFFQPVELVELCRSLMYRVDSLSRPLEIRAEFSSALIALPTLADRGALEEMLLALLSNSIRSIKAAGKRGAVTLELEQRDRKAIFTLKDNGGGMDAETLASVFDQESGEDPKLGLGLSLARQIAALHGGIMIVDNKENQGVRLAVSLPLLDKARGSLLRSPSADETGGWDKVLIALSDCLPPQSFLPKELS